VTWSADSIVLSSSVLHSSVWQHFRKLDMSADGQTDPVCSQLRVCNICSKEAKNDKTINFMVEVDGSNTTKMTNHMQKCHKGVVVNDRAKAVKEHVKQGSTLEKYLNHGGQFMTVLESDRDLPTDRYVRGSLLSRDDHLCELPCSPFGESKCHLTPLSFSNRR
jgi:BED zinc finger